jgi:hypothetical protein
MERSAAAGFNSRVRGFERNRVRGVERNRVPGVKDSRIPAEYSRILRSKGSSGELFHSNPRILESLHPAYWEGGVAPYHGGKFLSSPVKLIALRKNMIYNSDIRYG